MEDPLRQRRGQYRICLTRDETRVLLLNARCFGSLSLDL